MRIVWASATFAAGIASALVFGFAPGHSIPTLAFAMFGVATLLATVALVISRRSAAIPLLCVVFMLAAWHGAGAIDVLDDKAYAAALRDQSTDTSKNPFGLARRFTAETLKSSLGPSDAGLPTALLTGDRSGISTSTTSNFRSAGLAHLLAISGLHISLIGGIAMAASLQIFGRRRSAYLIIPLLTVLLYAGLAGFAPPVTRAAIMFAVFVLGRAMGRGSHTLPALALASTVMIALEPAIIASLSFQMSFLAMLAISLVTPYMEVFNEVAGTNVRGTRKPNLLTSIRRFIIGSLGISVAAIVGTLPVVALHFDAVPIWGPVATLMTVPALPILIATSALLAIFGDIPMVWVVEVAALPVMAATSYLEGLAEFFSELPPGAIETGSWTSWMSIGYFAAFVVAVFLSTKLRSVKRRSASTITGRITKLGSFSNIPHDAVFGLSATLLLIGGVGWGTALTSNGSDPHLSVRFFETDYGESILIETPNGNRMLIDGGGDDTQVADTLDGLFRFSDKHVDVILLTHADADHVGGLPEVVRRFDVGTIVHPSLSSESDVFGSWATAISDRDDVLTAWRGMMIGLDQDVFVEVLSAGCIEVAAPCSTRNDASTVARLRYRDVSFLFTADIEKAGEANLVSTRSDLSATLLKAPHHGSKTSSTQTFLDAVNPAVVVVSPGSNNFHGHPDTTVLDRLIDAVGEERVLRTDLLGTIEFQTDGARLWMSR